MSELGDRESLLDDDPFRTDEWLTPDERALLDRIRSFGDRHVLPVINEAWERADPVPDDAMQAYRALGIVGGTVVGNGCPGLRPIAAGAVTAELARIDGSLSTFHVVQSGLVMPAIDRLGSDEQRRRWLPALASMDLIGAFALTEPAHGSDSVSLETTVRRDGPDLILDGHKRWIGNGASAGLTLVAARDEDGLVGLFAVQPPTGGYVATVIERKGADRSMEQADIVLRAVRVSPSARLPGVDGFGPIAGMLASSRLGVAWSALGHALACFDLARSHAIEREQFGRPLAAFQLTQAKLADMLTQITSVRLMVSRGSQLQAEGALTLPIASMAKYHAARVARTTAAKARTILGGDGILLARHVARHLADVEAVFTYEGTDEIQALLVGRAITGISAFSGGAGPSTE
ncbi:MAG TPA: acyl-CoA dehydrogenase family protein [Actinomycetota bacterium]